MTTTYLDLVAKRDLQEYLDFQNEAFGYDAYYIEGDSIMFEDIDGDVGDVTAAVVEQFIQSKETLYNHPATTDTIILNTIIY